MGGVRQGIQDEGALPAAAIPAGHQGLERTQGHAKSLPLFAALDLGTNNCRLLIARARRSGGFRVVDSFSRIVRLGEGLAQSGVLSETAMTRAVDALAVCANKIERWHVSRKRLVATAACRQAGNAPAFIARVRQETGLSLEIISAEEEAKLTVASCAPLFDYQHRSVLVFDIGGGSTELVWLELLSPLSFRIAHWMSVPLGVVTLADLFGGQDVSPALYERMIAHARALISEAAVPGGEDHGMTVRQAQMMGTSGTVTILASLHLNLDRYERHKIDGLWLMPEEITRVAAKLRAMSYDDRAQHGCIGRERADLVIPGAAIFEAIWRQWPCQRLRVADRGLREGMLMGLINAEPPPKRKRARRRRRNGTRTATSAPAVGA